MNRAAKRSSVRFAPRIAASQTQPQSGSRASLSLVALDGRPKPGGAQPMDCNAALQRAQALQAAGQMAESREAYLQVARLQPANAEIHHLLGRIFHDRMEVDQAREMFVAALRLRPEFAECMSHLAALLLDLGELPPAEALLRRALQLEPRLLSAHCNLGSLLARRGDLLGGIECLRNALALDPRHANALCTLGYLLDNLGDAEGAVTCFRLALESNPGMAAARFNLSPHLLAAGEFAQGWRDYELRWQVKQFAGTPRDFARPRWQGEDLQGARIYVHAEQGLGDTLQFCRYAPLLLDRGAEEVILEVQPALLELLSGFHPWVRVVARPADQSIPAGLPPFQWHCPLMSLPGLLGTTLETVPASPAYLFADPARQVQWQHRIGTRGFRVGVVWSGSPGHARDRLRSIPWQQFRQVLQGMDGWVFSLQKGPAAEDLRQDGTASVVDLDPLLESFSDTAAAISHMDLVITVDTSVAHLAGALGKPVWILLQQPPDWRWLRNRTDSPWYPSARLFRQSATGQWDAVLQEVRAGLLEFGLEFGYLQFGSRQPLTAPLIH